MSLDSGEGLRLLGGMLTVEPGTGREGGTCFHSAQLFNMWTSSFPQTPYCQGQMSVASVTQRALLW